MSTQSKNGLLKQVRKAILDDHIQHPHQETKQEAIRFHLILHETVENQVEKDDPPETAKALERLMKNGIARHEAVHEVGKIVAKQTFQMMKTGQPLDLDTYVKKLSSLGKVQD